MSAPTSQSQPTLGENLPRGHLGFPDGPFATRNPPIVVHRSYCCSVVTVNNKDSVQQLTFHSSSRDLGNRCVTDVMCVRGAYM